MADLIFANESLEFVPFQTGLYLWQTWGTDNLVPFELVMGETYTVSWDGETFTCVALTNGELYGIGNLYYGGLGEDTGEPFVVGITADGSNTFILTPKSGNHSLMIYRGVPGEGIVLKDRNGTDLVFKGKEKVKIPTESGGKQIFSRGEAITNVPIELDFSGGNQSVTAPAGQLVKSAVIYKPETLLPENIAEGVDIAGVLGTLAAGGGGGGAMAPLMWTRVRCLTRHYYASASTTLNFFVSHFLPKEAIIHCYIPFYTSGATTTATGTANSSVEQLVQGIYDSLAGYTNYKQLSDSIDVYSSKGHISACAGSVVIFSVPGVYIQQLGNGDLAVYADETATIWPTGSYDSGTGLGAPVIRAVKHIDLSNSNIKSLGGFAFAYSGASEILLPGTIETVESSFASQIANVATHPVIVDFSKHTFVPTISSTFYGSTGLIVRVPATLYDEWITDNNWKYGADCIEAV